ncbi:MAG: hypothetical protein U7123_22125 [Potamolinea sp.]
MRLSHRAINYEKTLSTLEVTESEIGVMHRGETREFRYLRHIPEPLSLVNRQYPHVVAVPSQTLPIKKKSEALDELMYSHLRNIQRSLEHRLEVAKANGDRRLIRLLEAESQQFTLNF